MSVKRIVKNTIALMLFFNAFTVFSQTKYIMYGDWFKDLLSDKSIPVDRYVFTNDILPQIALKSDIGDPIKTIAMFEIPINYGTDGTFTDFELKATTNNYASASGEYVRLQFYAQSEIANSGISIQDAIADGKNENSSIDRMYIFETTSRHSGNSGYTGDNRGYFYIKNTIDWNFKPSTVIVLIDTSCLERHKENVPGQWLSNANEELIWSYTRYASNGGEVQREKESGTTSVLWRPITPVKWFKEMPKWAIEQF